MIPPQSLAVELADAFRQQAVAAGASTPSVRGGDWRQATVATVDSGGTVTTTDGIIVRRLESYTNPTVGDLIVIGVSGSGQWVAHGRMATAADVSWTAYTPAWTSSGTQPSIGNGAQLGRYMLHGKTCHVSIRIAAGSTTVVGTGTYLFGLPFTSAAQTVEYTGGARLSGNGPTWIGQCFLGSNASIMNATFPVSTTATNGANLSATSPEAFTTSSILRMSLTYQIA